MENKNQAMRHEVFTSWEDFPQRRELKFWVGNDICEAMGRSRHVLDNRLISNEITAIYGEPKAGKTFVAVACAVSCVAGSEFWGQRFPAGASVIYVAAERFEQAAERVRAQFQYQGFDMIPKEFTLVGGVPAIRLSDSHIISKLKELVSNINPSLIVFDTYVRLTDNDEDSSRDADNNVQILTDIVRSSQCDCAGLLVHHAGKDQRRGMRGSSALLAAVTTVWKVTQKSKNRQVVLSMEDANTMDVASPCQFEIVSLEIPRGDSDGHLEVGVAVPAGEMNQELSRAEKVLELIRSAGDSGMTIDQLRPRLQAAIVGSSDSTIRRVLGSLVNSGSVNQTLVGKKIVYRCH